MRKYKTIAIVTFMMMLSLHTANATETVKADTFNIIDWVYSRTCTNFPLCQRE